MEPWQALAGTSVIAATLLAVVVVFVGVAVDRFWISLVGLGVITVIACGAVALTLVELWSSVSW